MQPTWISSDSRIKLYLGDCLELLPTLAASGIDAVVTDPPYGVFFSGGKWGHKESLQWNQSPVVTLEAIIKLGREAIVWGGNYYALPPSRGWLVWHKRDSLPSQADVELAWTNLDMNARLVDQTIAATNAERCGHPTQKPLAVMTFSLSHLSKGIETVADPFMGSGTTGVACIRSGHRFIGVEKDPAYFEIAQRRMELELQRTPLFDDAALFESANLFVGE